MENILLFPPIAFLIYMGLVWFLSYAGHQLAPKSADTAEKLAAYGSGEAAPTDTAVPGYRPFFVVALFFAVVHLGILVAGSGTLTPLVAIYIFGFVLALVALILG
ncbi:MAG: hypothetical protein GYB68_00400 [Chloroflexi bacterium]|nr:hypothetical protein [Chloroflexota bacterium]